MRKFLQKPVLLFLCVALSTTLFSCSSDDDSGTETKTEAEYLTEKNFWNFKSSETVEITINSSTPLTEEELETYVDDTYSGFRYSFSSNGTGLLIVPDFGEFNFDYNFDGNTISFSGDVVGELNNVDVTENEMKATTFVGIADPNDDQSDIEAFMRFTFN